MKSESLEIPKFSLSIQQKKKTLKIVNSHALARMAIFPGKRHLHSSNPTNMGARSDPTTYLLALF